MENYLFKLAYLFPLKDQFSRTKVLPYTRDCSMKRGGRGRAEGGRGGDVRRTRAQTRLRSVHRRPRLYTPRRAYVGGTWGRPQVTQLGYQIYTKYIQMYYFKYILCIKKQTILYLNMIYLLIIQKHIHSSTNAR